MFVDSLGFNYQESSSCLGTYHYQDESWQRAPFCGRQIPSGPRAKRRDRSQNNIPKIGSWTLIPATPNENCCSPHVIERGRQRETYISTDIATYIPAKLVLVNKHFSQWHSPLFPFGLCQTMLAVGQNQTPTAEAETRRKRVAKPCRPWRGWRLLPPFFELHRTGFKTLQFDGLTWFNDEECFFNYEPWRFKQQRWESKLQ